MELVKLKLLKNWKCYAPGDVVEVPPGVLPQRMIENGTAERYVPKKSKAEADDGQAKKISS